MKIEKFGGSYKISSFPKKIKPQIHRFSIPTSRDESVLVHRSATLHETSLHGTFREV